MLYGKSLLVIYFTCSSRVLSGRRKWQPTPVFLPGESQGQRTWWAAVYGVAQSQTQLKSLSSSSRVLSVSRAVVFNSLPPMDCSSPGSSVHGILQARILEWVVIPFSRGSSRPRDQDQVSCTAGRFSTT